jgi:hypothetical protein
MVERCINRQFSTMRDFIFVFVAVLEDPELGTAVLRVALLPLKSGKPLALMVGQLLLLSSLACSTNRLVSSL